MPAFGRGAAMEDEPGESVNAKKSASTNGEGKFWGLQDISPKKAKKSKIRKKLKERHKNIDAGTRSKKSDRFAEKRAKWVQS